VIECSLSERLIFIVDIIVVHGLACSDEIKLRIMPIVFGGINQHHKGENWMRWQSN